MTILHLPSNLNSANDGGLTHQQAMEVHRRYLELLQAAPTIAGEMGIPYKAVCNALDGKIWPGVHQHWIDRVLA